MKKDAKPARKPPTTVADALEALESRRRKPTAAKGKPNGGLDLGFIP